MSKNILTLSALSLFLISSVGCGKVCDQLEAKFCSDLGAEDCKIWKEDLKGIEALRTGRRADKACGNLMLNGPYDAMLDGYKKAIEAIKKSKAPKAPKKK